MYKTKLHYLSFFFFFALGQNVFGQCPSVDTLTFNTQQQLDAFLLDYPNCTYFPGDILIENTEITHFGGLGLLDSIGGDFRVVNNDSLLNFIGMESLQQINGVFEVSGNDLISDFEGLTGLELIDGELLVVDNDMLTNFEGLSALSTVSNFKVGDIEFEFDDDDNVYLGNDQLLNFLGLENLQTIKGNFVVESNATLLNFEGLSNLQFIGSTFRLVLNEALVNFSGLESLDSISGNFFLSTIACHENGTEVYGNENLIDFTGLNSLQSIGGKFYLFAEESLVSFSGLENLQYIAGTLQVGTSYCYFGDGNYYDGIPNLVNFLGLENLQQIGGGLRLYGNGNLLNFQGLNNLASIGESFVVIRNDDLVNFEGLDNLTTIAGDFRVGTYDSSDDDCDGNSDLLNFQGLSNLQFIGGDFNVDCNNYLVNFAGLENLQFLGGRLDIERNNNLINFSGLDNLQSSLASLRVFTNQNLTSFTGLHHIDSIEGSFRIRENNNITDFEGLEDLQSVAGQFSIWNNAALANFQGLENLQSIGGDFTAYSNNSLNNFHGLENLQSLQGRIWLTSNDQLQSLSGLNIQDASSIDDLWIYNNDSLSLCSEPFICNYLSSGLPSNIYNNALGCNSSVEIMFNCEDYGQINHPIFYDLDENGSRSINEPFLSSGSVTISPLNRISYGNTENGGLVFLPFGNYSLALNDDIYSQWELTTTDTLQSTTLDSLHTTDTLYWGLRPIILETDINTAVVNGLTRCNEFVNFQVMALNEGTTTANGTLWFEIDLEVLTIDYIDMPDTIDGDWRIGWHFQQLYPDQVIKKNVSLQLPGPPVFPIGEILNFETQVDFNDQNGVQITNPSAHEVAMQCAYDPNDKLVSPVNPNNYALINEDLIYTIRFQNTGNAEAYDVVIRDELDSNLDLSTFQYITSSHESVLSTYLEGNNLTFEFRNIFLPDSTTNFDASQGYVTYSIRAKADLEDYTNIENTANIFFDFNPAVITNTTENVMLSTFDFDEDGFELWNDCDDNPATGGTVNADATEIPYNGIDDDCNNNTPDDDLDGDGVLFADDCDDNNPLVTGISVEIPYNGIDDDCDPATPDDDLDGDGVPLIGDCDDTNPLVNYNMVEIPYNGLDDDCNIFTLDDDLDQDGYGIAEDCDDNPATGGTINPDAVEIPYNGVDDDCNNSTPDDDLDGDGLIAAEDCDDSNPLLGNIEIPYNGIDDDCDETTLDDDLDQDGFGIAEDCDDLNPDINTDAEDIPNNDIDEDCDGQDLITIGTNNLLTIKPRIFPNPTSSFLQVKFHKDIEGTYELRAISGKLVDQNKLQQKLTIDLSNQAQGVYILIFKSKDYVWTEQVVKM